MSDGEEQAGLRCVVLILVVVVVVVAVALLVAGDGTALLLSPVLDP